jgi:multicomponent Na+:H+ antiporter subunit E
MTAQASEARKRSAPGEAFRLVSLTVALFVFWLLLSGHYTPKLVVIGAVSSVLCTLLARRMGLTDPEGHPVHLMGRFVTFGPWILWEIVKSGWAVTKIILAPRLAISPTMTRVVATQRTTPGVVTYANSITLTPGTVTTRVRGNVLTVFALTRDGADDLEAGGMDARITRFEGEVTEKET